MSDADQILVLADGEVVERGTHDELIELGEVYTGNILLVCSLGH